MSIKPEALVYLQDNPGCSGADLARAIGIPKRSARRYVKNYKALHLAPTFELADVIPVEYNSGVVFDIETTDFGTEGHSGWLICVSFLPLSSLLPYTIKIEFGAKNDKALLERVAAELAKYRFHIGHNIAAFDYNWLNSKLMHHKLPLLNSSFYFDTYQVAKSMAIKTPKSLGNLLDYFGLDGVKTRIYRTSWSKVRSSDVAVFDEAIKNIVYHCEQDVIGNRNLYDILFHYALNVGNNPLKVTKFRGRTW